MKKYRSRLKKGRARLCLFCVFILFAVCCVSLSNIMLSKNAAAAARNNSSISLNISTQRGQILDRRLRPLTEQEKGYYICAAPTEHAVMSLKNILSGEKLENALERLIDGKPIVFESDNETALAGLTCVSVMKRYSGTAPHIIGYLGDDKRGVTGIEADFDEILYNGLSSKIRYTVDATGGVLPGVEPEIALPIIIDNKVVLTLDREIQRITEDVMSRVECGAAVVSDIKTGEILAIVSRPDFDQNDVAAALENDNAPLLNRALTKYNVGSVFKPIVVAAALENGENEEITVKCEGHVKIGETEFVCHKADGHGEIDIKGALANSCNVFFYSLSAKPYFLETLKISAMLGFTQDIPLSFGITSGSGVLPSVKLLQIPAAAANFSIGQGDLMLSPLQINSIYAAIANDGVYCVPILVKGVITPEMNIDNPRTPEITAFSKATADKISEYLKLTVMSGTGTAAKSEKFEIAGKTATAQTGWYKKGSAVKQSWFAGFFPADEPKYALTVLVEDGTSGAANSAPLFLDIAEQIMSEAR